MLNKLILLFLGLLYRYFSVYIKFHVNIPHSIGRVAGANSPFQIPPYNCIFRYIIMWKWAGSAATMHAGNHLCDHGCSFCPATMIIKMVAVFTCEQNYSHKLSLTQSGSCMEGFDRMN